MNVENVHPFLYSLDSHLINGNSLDPHESTPKRHLDRFSRFCRLTSVTNGQTDTQTHTETDYATPFVAIARLLCNARDAA